MSEGSQTAATPPLANTTSGDEPPDHELPFAETDPSGRYGRFDEVLGRGACKVVYKAFDLQEGTEVAWNQVRLADVMSTKEVAKEDRDRMFAEIRVLKALKHKNIMSFYDSWFEPKTMTVNFITELFTSGTLRQYRKRHKHVDDEVFKRWAWQILCGLVYLHGHNPPIIHRDLKCDNIFINGSDGVVKIGDLGLATMLRSRTAPQSVLGTPEFMAPELYEEEYDDRVDVYSFGMALLELATLQYPYAECTNAAQIYRKVSLGVRPQGLQKVTSPELAEIINVCIAPRHQRPRARQLLKHPYFDSVRQTLAPCRSEMALVAAATTVGAEAASPLPPQQESPAAAAAPPESYAAAAAAHVPSLREAIAPAEGEQQQQPLLPGGGPASVGSCASQGVPSRTASDLSPEGVLPPGQAAPGDLSKAVDDAAAALQHRASVSSELAAALAGQDFFPPPGATAALLPGGSGNFAPSVGSHMGSRATSRAGSPPWSPAALGSPVTAASSEHEELIGSGASLCAATERCFKVVGRLRPDEANHDRPLLNLRLRILEPDGTTRTVEFEFDLTHDTVGSVASEMVLDLELSPDDADTITVAMMREIAELSSKMESHASVTLESAAAVLQQGLKENALLQASSLDFPPSPSEQEVEEPKEASQTDVHLQQQQQEVEEGRSRPHSDDELSFGGAALAAAELSHSQKAAATAAAFPLLVHQQHSLVSACSESSLAGSEASACSEASVHSAQSAHSIKSSPAQLAVPMQQDRYAAAGPPQPQRLMRASSLDRGFKPGAMIAAAGGTPGGMGGAGSFDRASSGALSPGSGVLSPVLTFQANPDKRSLSKLFENLQEVAMERENCATPPARPPLPPPNGSGLISANGSHHNLAGAGTSQFRLPNAKSSPAGLLAAAAAEVTPSALEAAFNGAGNGSSGSGTAASSSAGASPPGSENGCNGGHHLVPAHSAPTGELAAAAAAAVLACPKRAGPVKNNKEALRKHAADAMKAVELRSLTLLQSNLGQKGGGGMANRGAPMAATRQINGSSASSLTGGGGAGGGAAAAAMPMPMANGGGNGNNGSVSLVGSVNGKNGSSSTVEAGSAPASLASTLAS